VSFLMERITSYREFWPFYLSEHAKPLTRAWHMAGTATAIMLGVAAVSGASIGLLLAAAIAGYGPAWATHFLIEKNRPATFRYPVWSFISDLRMLVVWLAGGLSRELEKAEIRSAQGKPK